MSMANTSQLSLLLLMGSLSLRPLVTAAEAPAAAPDWATTPKPLATNQYLITELTTNVSSGAPNTDANLINPWGVARSSGGPWWVSDNGSGKSTLYSGAGAAVPVVVSIPAAGSASSAPGSPTGVIFNGTTDFAVAAGKPALFLFATEDGTISGWNPSALPTSAIIAVNESAQGASFKGLTAATATLPNHAGATLIYAADFTRAKIEVFDGTFKHVSEIEDRINHVGDGDDDDDDIPNDYGPFNVQNLGGNLYVTYAKHGVGIDEQNGPGFGLVRVYSPEGRLLLRLQRGAWFNAPWGVAIAPSDFGPYSHSILVGNFGSGWIAAFDPLTGKFQDFLRDSHGKLITIAGLWGIAPGNDANAGDATSLFFVAGGKAESAGVLGTLTALQNPQGNDQ
jgi:uncharacterized protein (TIGR03118 family)